MHVIPLTYVIIVNRIWLLGDKSLEYGNIPLWLWGIPSWVLGRFTLVVGKTHFGYGENPLWLLGHGQIWNLGLGTDHFGCGENPVWLRGKIFGCWDEKPTESVTGEDFVPPPSAVSATYLSPSATYLSRFGHLP